MIDVELETEYAAKLSEPEASAVRISTMPETEPEPLVAAQALSELRESNVELETVERADAKIMAMAAKVEQVPSSSVSDAAAKYTASVEAVGIERASDAAGAAAREFASEASSLSVVSDASLVDGMYQSQSSLSEKYSLTADMFNVPSEEPPNCVDLFLTYNYRSQANILAAAFDVISKNHDVVRRPLLAKRQDIDLAQMVSLTDPNADLLDMQASKEKILATYERLGALPHINQRRQKIVEDLSGLKMGSTSDLYDADGQLKFHKPICTMQPVVVHLPNVSMEAQFVIRTIIDIQKLDPQASIAVLYRTHFAAAKIEDELLRAEIPYRIVGSVSFFERKEIQDALAYMRLRVNPDDDLALRRVINVPPRKFGAKRMELLENLARRDRCSLFQALLRNSDNNMLYQRNRVNEFVQAILELNDEPLKDAGQDFELIMARSGYEEWLKLQGEDERLDNLAELKKHVVDYVALQGENVNLADFLYSVMLLSEADDAEQNRKEVQLMTIHSSKGLEFDYVFLISVNEAIFPSRKSVSANNLEEERRLMYVAMTRARKQLIISEAGGCVYMYLPGTIIHGQASTVKLERKPSRFLAEIQATHYVELGAQLLKQREEEEARKSQHQSEDTSVSPYEQTRNSLNQQQPTAAQSLLNNYGAPKGFKFPVGAIIKHSVFGEGQILECNEDLGEYVIFFTQIKRKRNITALVANRNVELIKLPEHLTVASTAPAKPQSAPSSVPAQVQTSTQALALTQTASTAQDTQAVTPSKQSTDVAAGVAAAVQSGFKEPPSSYVLPEGAPYFESGQLEPGYNINDLYIPDDVPGEMQDEDDVQFGLEPPSSTRDLS